MKVFKFGGASLKDAKGIRNVATILKNFRDNLVVVVSAFGKTTNALEKIFMLHQSGKNYELEVLTLKTFHQDIARDLLRDSKKLCFDIDVIFKDLETALVKTGEPDEIYDQVISKGEILSSVIVNQYLISQQLPSVWLDAREYIYTDNTFREGKVEWEKTSAKIQSLKSDLTKRIFITQGFIGKTDDGLTTTLGREGSDFSAAIFASCLDAESVTIWKDVPGVMSADPKRIPDAIIFRELPFKEAAEMTYYGASVIHPKTIRPLANKNIPLYVKNFTDPSLPGTVIHECEVSHLPPLIVFKDNQCLVSCRVTDYAFVNEVQITKILAALTALDIKINVMQNSAISFSVCIDFRENKVMALIRELQKDFEVYYNTGLTLITVKNYDEASFEMYRNKSGILLEQSSRSTLQVLVKL